MNSDTCLLSSTYFGPVQWYQKLNRCGKVLLEQHEHFVKQTYRNRCVIASANGPQTLSVPIEKYEGAKCAMKDIRISDHGNWRHIHWNALLSAYGESPFFEYLADDIRPFFERRWDYLFDFNLEITYKMCELLDIEANVEATEGYAAPLQPSRRGEEAPPRLPSDSYSYLLGDGREGSATVSDFRDAIRPKHPQPDASFLPRRYYQVYEQRHGFLPNLSILDLLFNQGNEAVLYL